MADAAPLHGRRGHGRDAQPAAHQRNSATSTQGRLSRGHLMPNSKFHHVDGRDPLVADQLARWRDSRDQRGGGGDVSDVAAGQQDRVRAALVIAERVDLGGAPAARAADRLVAGVAFTPLFAPAAERCAFTAELSIIVTCGGSAQATRATKMRCHSPRWLQRFHRLKIVVYGPYSGGKARQRPPSRSRWMMPLITRRSSTRRGPVWTIGRCGAMAAHCTSFSQNRRDTVHPLPFGRVNHRTAFTSIGYRP